MKMAIASQSMYTFECLNDHSQIVDSLLQFTPMIAQVTVDEQWRRAMEYVSMVSELNYMSQVVVMLYEDPTKEPLSEER